MRIILTGGSGFLGRGIKSALSDHEIISVGRANADVNVDLARAIPELPVSDLVIHAAGKAHVVPKTQAENQDFFDVNVDGTKNLLSALKNASGLPKYFVFISSVSVYGIESGDLIKEDNPLLATDAYGQSKIMAEQIVQQWCNENNVIYSILRLPLIVGPNPPGNLNSMINSIKRGYYFNIGGGQAKKSMVLIEDVAQIIPKAATIGGIYNLTDSYHPSFAELARHISKQLHRAESINIPFWLAVIFARAGDLLGKSAPLNTSKLKKITTTLTFDDAKAFQILNWLPTPVLKDFRIR